MKLRMHKGEHRTGRFPFSRRFCTYLSGWQNRCRLGYWHLSLTIPFLVLWPVLVSAQIPGAMNETTKTNLGGNTYVVGTVFAPSGKPLSYRMRIKLVSTMRGE